jgi:SsrA-binding protein
MERIRHKKATFNYEVLETLEAGIELLGFEVAAIKNKLISFEGSYVIINNDNQVFIKNLHISPFQEKNTPDSYEPERPRRLLLKKSEIARLKKSLSTKGLTLIPLAIYQKGRRMKLEIALARGKNRSDKRNTIKDRDNKRELGRLMKES